MTTPWLYLSDCWQVKSLNLSRKLIQNCNTKHLSPPPHYAHLSTPLSHVLYCFLPLKQYKRREVNLFVNEMNTHLHSLAHTCTHLHTPTHTCTHLHQQTSTSASSLTLFLFFFHFLRKFSLHFISICFILNIIKFTII